MQIYKLIISYLLTAIVFFTVDLLWLGLIAKKFYDKQLASFLADKINWPAAIIFYLLFIIGIFIFAILPAVEKSSAAKAWTLGALFGFFTYATYDLTNLATLQDWPLKVVFVDITWGIVLTSTVSLSGYYITKWIS
ncbi:MAG: DUF2177 family protein [Reichenbachiella sp.]|uniref:DUF2177 family protein n=1 Tax=Reichenbachiella sp. TaxID=2184521 RepID=UPI00326344D6